MVDYSTVAQILHDAADTVRDSGEVGVSEAAEQIHALADVLVEHGPAVVALLLRLVPLGYARGESREELLEMAERYGRGRVSNLAISFAPEQPYPVEVVNTGGYRPEPTSLTLVRAVPARRR